MHTYNSFKRPSLIAEALHLQMISECMVILETTVMRGHKLELRSVSTPRVEICVQIADRV